MDALWDDFATAHQKPDGYLLASTLSPEPPASDPARLYNFNRWTTAHSVQTDLRYKLQYNPALSLDKREASAWLDVFTAYYHFVAKLLAAEEAQTAGKKGDADWSAVFKGWVDVVGALAKGYQNSTFESWTIPCLYCAAKYLRVFAIKADDQIASQRDSGLAFGGLQEEDAFDPSSQHETLEDAARQINRLFALCIGDRNPIEESRKWALYGLANFLIKTYFKLSSVSLCRNIIRSLRASSDDMPALSQYPMAHQVTFKYYNGVLCFLEEDYPAAEEFLSSAYEMCNKKAMKNVQLILTYLIPTKMMTSHRLPTQEFLSVYPNLERLYGPIREAIRRADLAAFDAALEKGEDEFVKRRVYLTLERGRDIILRNLFRKVFVIGGFETPKEGETGPPVRRTRVPAKEFAAALQLAGADVGDGNGGIDMDEVECLIANSIYKVRHPFRLLAFAFWTRIDNDQPTSVKVQADKPYNRTS